MVRTPRLVSLVDMRPSDIVSLLLSAGLATTPVAAKVQPRKSSRADPPPPQKKREGKKKRPCKRKTQPF